MRLCRALDDEDRQTPWPFTYWLGRLCEEFPCYGPEEAYRAWLRAPAGLFEEIVEGRQFAAMKRRVDGATREEDVPQDTLARLVLEIEEAVAQEDIDRDAAAAAD